MCLLLCKPGDRVGRVGAMLARTGRDRPAECVICGAIANPEERHPLRLRLDARGGLRHGRS